MVLKHKKFAESKYKYLVTKNGIYQGEYINLRHIMESFPEEFKCLSIIQRVIMGKSKFNLIFKIEKIKQQNV